MANIKDFIKKIGNSAVSLEEQQQALAQVEQTIIEAKQKRTEAIGKNAEMVVQALKTIEAKLEAKLEELNNTPAKQGIQGPAGKPGKDGKDGLNGRDGVNGKDGKDGKDGVDGNDGVSVVDAKIDFDGSLVIYLSNGSEIDAGQILSPDVAQNIIINSGGSGTSQTVTDTLVSLQNQITSITNEIAPNTGITGWNYSGLSKSISAEESNPTGLFFSPDGLNMYVNGSTGDDVNQYTLSTAWDVSTASYVRVFSTAAQDSAPTDVFFKSDGLIMYIVGDTNNTIFQYTLSSAWDISTASYASKSFSVASQETNPAGLWFKPDGTVMYIVGSNSDTVYQYNLGTAWDISTASYASISFSVAAQESNPQQINLNADGTKMWIVGSTGDDINEYNLATPWNVSTATFVNNFYVGFQDTAPTGLFIDSSVANRVYIVGQTNDTVYQYNTETNSISAITDVFNTTSNARVQGNLSVQNNAYVDGTFTAIGAGVLGSLSTAAITATSTLTLSGSTTSTTTLGTSATTGTTTIGGTSQTGAITVGQSTAAQTLNLGTGATANATTKTVNIGTAGVSGSTTNINIGSSVSGSLGTTTIQAPTVNIGQTATQFQVTNTASAVNYVQTTGSLTGFGAKLLSAGSDTNIPLVLQPKGTGALQAQQTDSTATGGNARGANAVDWQTSRSTAASVASGQYSVLGGGINSLASGTVSGVFAGNACQATNFNSAVLGGTTNIASGINSGVVTGNTNTASGYYGFVGTGFTNSTTSGSAVTTQSGTMNGTTAVTLSGSNASIKVGQYITGTSIANDTYVAAISGTSLTLSKNASGSSTSTLSFFTPHGVVVGGGNNQATGAYSFIGGGGDAGNSAFRNTASGDWSVVCGGTRNTASGNASFVGGGGVSPPFGTFPNTASGQGSSVVGGFSNIASAQGSFAGGGYANTANGQYSAVIGGSFSTTRSISGNHVFSACDSPITTVAGVSQSALLVLGVQTTDATATVLRSNTNAASTTNQVILPNNSAYYFRGEVISGVTGGGNTKGWYIEGVIKRGANAASTALVGTPTVTSNYADAGASTWTIAVTADTTNGGLAVTFTGQAGTTIRTVCQIRTTEMTF